MNPTFPKLADGNRSLELLRKEYDCSDSGLNFAIHALPYTADRLMEFALHVVKTFKELDSWSQEMCEKKDDVALCLFDLAVLIFFQKMKSLFGSDDLASLLADSLIFQGTGIDPMTAEEENLWHVGTSSVRGIHKYSIAFKAFHPHISDPSGWLFGKEMSRTLHDSLDISHVYKYSALSIDFRVTVMEIINSIFVETAP